MRYYSIFLNSMAAIARGYGAKIIKNVGDSLIYYFPETSNVTKWSGFKGVLESATTMISAHKVINAKLSEEKIPLVDYRISADYGRVEIAKSSSSMSEDLFGTTINICSKINTKASQNGLIIGGDLYRVLKRSFSDISNAYSFREKGDHPTGIKQSYPIYHVIFKLEPRAKVEVASMPASSLRPGACQTMSSAKSSFRVAMSPVANASYPLRTRSSLGWANGSSSLRRAAAGPLILRPAILLVKSDVRVSKASPRAWRRMDDRSLPFLSHS